jgi:hypothetical protein
MAAPLARNDSWRMLRKIVAAALWGFFAWYLVSFAGQALPLPAASGPGAALLIAAVSMVDLSVLRRTQTPDKRMRRAL